MLWWLTVLVGLCILHYWISSVDTSLKVSQGWPVPSLYTLWLIFLLFSKWGSSLLLQLCLHNLDCKMWRQLAFLWMEIVSWTIAAWLPYCVCRLCYFIALLWVFITYYCWVLSSNAEETMKVTVSSSLCLSCAHPLCCLRLRLPSRSWEPSDHRLPGSPQGRELESWSHSWRRTAWPAPPPCLGLAFLSAFIVIVLCKLGSSSMPFFKSIHVEDNLVFESLIHKTL